MSAIPLKYAPPQLTPKDRKRQIKMLNTSRALYKKNKYYTRKKINSYKNKKSNHVANAVKLYNVKNVTPGTELSSKTGCSISALRQIVRKGEGAYYSSGSRPNQTPQSWGLARLASAITGGKSAAVDFDIINKGCSHKKKAFILANSAKRKYGYGHAKTKKIKLFE